MGCGYYALAQFGTSELVKSSDDNQSKRVLDSISRTIIDLVMNWLSQLPYPWCSRSSGDAAHFGAKRNPVKFLMHISAKPS